MAYADMKRFLKKCSEISLLLGATLWCGWFISALVYGDEDWIFWPFSGSYAFLFLSFALAKTIGEDCPSCNSERVGTVLKQASVYLGNDVYRDSYECRTCGYDWNVERTEDSNSGLPG